MSSHFISKVMSGFIEFWQKFYAEFMHYPEWFCRLRAKAYKYFWPVFILYFFMLVMVCFVWPSMHEPSIRSSVYDMYPDWFSYLMKLCWEYIPATKRHTYNAAINMKPYMIGIYTVLMIFFVPSILCCFFICDVSKVGEHMQKDSFIARFVGNKFFIFIFSIPFFSFVSLYFLFFHGADAQVYDDIKYVKNYFIFNTRFGVCTVGGLAVFISYYSISFQVHVLFKAVLSFFLVFKQFLSKGVVNE